MRKKTSLVLLLVAIFLLVLSYQTQKPIPEVESYKGTFEEVLKQVEEKYGPWKEKVILDNGAWLKGELSIQILEDNYLQGDYVLLISY